MFKIVKVHNTFIENNFKQKIYTEKNNIVCISVLIFVCIFSFNKKSNYFLIKSLQHIKI